MFKFISKLFNIEPEEKPRFKIGNSYLGTYETFNINGKNRYTECIVYINDITQVDNKLFKLKCTIIPYHDPLNYLASEVFFKRESYRSDTIFSNDNVYSLSIDSGRVFLLNTDLDKIQKELKNIMEFRNSK